MTLVTHASTAAHASIPIDVSKSGDSGRDKTRDPSFGDVLERLDSKNTDNSKAEPETEAKDLSAAPEPSPDNEVLRTEEGDRELVPTDGVPPATDAKTKPPKSSDAPFDFQDVTRHVTGSESEQQVVTEGVNQGAKRMAETIASSEAEAAIKTEAALRETHTSEADAMATVPAKAARHTEEGVVSPAPNYENNRIPADQTPGHTRLETGMGETSAATTILSEQTARPNSETVARSALSETQPLKTAVYAPEAAATTVIRPNEVAKTRKINSLEGHQGSQAETRGAVPEGERTRSVHNDRPQASAQSMPPNADYVMATTGIGSDKPIASSANASMPNMAGNTVSASQFATLLPSDVVNETGSQSFTPHSSVPQPQATTAPVIAKQVWQAQPSAPTRIDSMQVGVATSDGRIEVTLKPEELGRVSLRLDTTQSMTSVLISSERPETQDMVRKNLDTLQAHLEDMGFSNLEFSFEGERQEPQSEHEQTRQEPSDDLAAHKVVQTYTMPLLKNGLDIRV